MSFTTWNYRVIQHSDGCSISSTYYDSQGKIVAVGEGADSFFSNSKEDSILMLCKYIDAFSKPMVGYKDNLFYELEADPAYIKEVFKKVKAKIRALEKAIKNDGV